MRKSSSITDFFKPFAQARQNKRPLPHNDSHESRAIRPSPRVELELPKAKAMEQEKEPVVPTDPSRNPSGNTQDYTLNAQDVQYGGVNESATNARYSPSINSSDALESQGPVLTSSQRVIKNGEVMITNSEDEASGSDTSLGDIDDILASRMPARNSSPPTEPKLPILKINNKNGRAESRKRKTRGAANVNESSRLPTLPVMSKYTFSLDTLVKQSKNQAELENQTTKTQLLLQSLERQENTTADGGTRISDKGPKVNEELVASVMKQHDEDEGVGRLMTAIQRTEALYQGKSWSFFDGKEDIPKSREDDFPQVDQFNSVFVEVHSRQQAFLSGYVGEIAEKGRLPQEILLWIVDAVCIETRDDLIHSYIYTLKISGNQISSLLTPEHLNRLFRTVGASTEALSKQRLIVPKPVIPPDKDENHRPRLLSIIRLLRDLAVFFSAESRTHTIYLLCRLLLDGSIINQSQVMVGIERAFTRLLESMSDANLDEELHVVLRTIYPCTEDSILRLQLLQNISASSPRLATFRRRLSLAFFFHNTQYLNKQPKNPVDLRQIAQYLRKPQFAIRNNTDYTEFAASISILSIAVDAGDPPSSSCDASQAAAFDADVDVLLDRIKSMFTQIIDTGASHMRRTEAKEILEAFHSRLLYAVRTRRKPKTMLVGDSSIDIGPDSRQGAIMKGFLERAMQNVDLPVPD